MKIAVVGSREFKDEDFIMEKLHDETKFLVEDRYTIISGGARGVDTIAEAFAKERDIETKIFEAKWNDLTQPGAIIKTSRNGKKYDARAGFRRNKLIINEADKVIAFWNGSSKGTKHSIDLAIKANKPLDIYVR